MDLIAVAAPAGQWLRLARANALLIDRLAGRLRFSRDASGHHAVVTLPLR